MINLIYMAIGLALSAIRRNKMRSVLTMLGVIIGVGAVIAMVSIGQGASSSVQAQIQSLGTNMILIFPGSTTQSGVRIGSGSNPTLTVDDAKSIEKQASAVATVTYVIRGVEQVVYENQNWSTAIFGVTPEYIIVRDWPVDRGSFFISSDLDGATKVAVLGKTVADNLFPSGNDPIGQTIRIKNVPFRVIGVLSPKGQTAYGSDQDDVVIIPFTTAETKVLGAQLHGRVGNIQVSAVSEKLIPEATRQIREILRARHRLQPKDDDDFTIRTQVDIANAAQSTTRVLTILLLSIASISLIVGGVGIMNIMLVSVTERTREIGIRMAVGAKRRDILLQFLVEALALSLIGGVIGIFIGILSSKILSLSAGWPTLISGESILLSFIFAACVGIFFGFYPANKASRLDPIEALRYE
jgi:putative ABC transport system permease protein